MSVLTSRNIDLDAAFLSPTLDNAEIIGDWVCSLMQDLEQDRRPTAFLCFNDTHASYVLNQLLKLGLRVPEDVSLIGFDDSVAAELTPPLSTIAQPYRDISLRAVECLLTQIDIRNSPPERHLLPGHLIRRQSVASSKGF
jgi:DNA-binding LacI/PurR family transcriptional regulator